MNTIQVKKVDPRGMLPTYGSRDAAGADLYACLEENITIPAGETRMIPTGLAMEIPQGCVGLIFARSSLASKRDLAPANKVGVIDADYRGQILVALHNHGAKDQVICHGERVAQMLIMPVLHPDYVQVETLSDTQRGQGGFGSTGK